MKIKQLSFNPVWLKSGAMWKIVVLVAAAAAIPAASAIIYRPCYLDRYDCISDILAYNSHCNVTKNNTVSSDHFEKYFRFDTPHFNATYVDVNLHIRNLDKCFVSAFYINGTSDTAVLGIDCPWLEFESDRLMYQHRSLEEDQEYNFHIKGAYPLIRLTTTLRHARHMDLCTAFTFADVTALPIFKVDPKDQKTKNYLSHDLSRLFIYERESFFYRAPRIARYIINNMLCYFGCY